jgi:hypothetical protein
LQLSLVKHEIDAPCEQPRAVAAHAPNTPFLHVLRPA